MGNRGEFKEMWWAWDSDGKIELQVCDKNNNCIVLTSKQWAKAVSDVKEAERPALRKD